MSPDDFNHYMNANPHLIQVVAKAGIDFNGAMGIVETFLGVNCVVPYGKVIHPLSVEEATEDLNDAGYTHCWATESHLNWFAAAGSCIRLVDALRGHTERLSRWTYRLVLTTHHDELLGDVRAPTHVVFGFMNEREATFAKMFD